MIIPLYLAISTILSPILVSPKASVNLSEFSEGPSWSGLGALAVQGEAEGTGHVQPGEEMT